VSVTDVIQAAWVAPMDVPPLRDAAIAVGDGLVVAVGPAKQVAAAYPDARVTDLGDSIVLPGLVNAHTHLELSTVVRPATAGKFVDWIMDLMSQTFRTGQADGSAVGDAVRRGIEESIRFGVTSVGDITKQCTATRPIQREGPLRVVSYGEIQAMAQRRVLLEERFASAVDCTSESPWLRVGVTPHAPYTVEREGYRKCLDFARAHGRPIATHLAETPEEAEFLAAGTGEFRRLWEVGVNAWDEHVPTFAGGPIRFAEAVGLLSYPTLLAHVNYCDDDELAILAGGSASVVYCPRTHAYFGHRPHRWREMLAAGINVAVGTDSRASAPDLNLVDELRLLRQLAPDVPAIELWAMATTHAAKAIGLLSVGSIAPGKAADFAVFPARDEQPLESILQQPALPSRVYIAGVLLPG
jgi:cytosine/adenosine deaminase-related metal-dependent hydrolase